MIETPYLLSSDIPTNFQRKYTLTVRDIPQEDRPREKLSNIGGDALSLIELLAVVLSSGTRKEGVLEMSRRIVKEYGEKNLLMEKNPQRLSEQLGIPLVKACQVVASVEIGRRLFEKSNGGQTTIRNAKDMASYVDGMRFLNKEYFRGIYLNSHYKIIHDEVISIGTVDGSIVHPREVFRPAIERSAAGIIVVHNHPSGDPTPSKQDIEVTEQLKQASQLLGIEFVDHVVIGFSSYVSIIDSYLSE